MISSQRSVVVTGAASGIGLAITSAFLDDGFVVVGLDTDGAGLLEAEANFSGSFVPLVGDITQWSDHERAAEQATSRGPLHAWVNNAAIDMQMSAHTAESNAIDGSVALLLTGPLYGCAVATRYMLQSGGGTIVNITSTQGSVAFPRYFVYGPAKAALIQVTKNLAIDYGAYGVRAVAVSPGVIETPLSISSIPQGIDVGEALGREAQLSPMLRLGQPQEVAGVVKFVCSDDASYINGTEIRVDGGQTARAFPFPPMDLHDEDPGYRLPPLIVPD